MSETRGVTFSSENRSNALALMKFFSFDAGSEMNIASASGNFHVQENKLLSKEFLFKVIHLVTGFICITVYSECIQMPASTRYALMFPSIVFSSFIIITSVIVFSYILKCAMPDIQARMFHILGMILYFASAAVTVSEGLKIEVNKEKPELMSEKIYCFTISAISYFNSIMYGADVYYSIKKAIGKEIKFQTV